MKAVFPGRALILPLLVLALWSLACVSEDWATATMSSHNPPEIKFSFSGLPPPPHARIAIEEVADKGAKLSKTTGDMGKLVWQIRLQAPGLLGRWPLVRYGQIPPGGTQTEPATGPPPPLVEGKIYRCLVGGVYIPDMIFF
jgi:hypothetical protein